MSRIRAGLTCGALLWGCGGSATGRHEGPADDAAVVVDGGTRADGDVDAAGADAGSDAGDDPRFVTGESHGPGWWLRTLAIQDGNLGWSAVAVDPSGRIHVAGGGALAAGIRAHTEVYDPIVQSYDTAGHALRRLGSIDVPGNTWVSGLAAGPSNLLCLSGGHIAAGLPVSPNADPWARCYDASGTVVIDWLRPSQWADDATGIAIDASGAVVTAGSANVPDPYPHAFVGRLLPGGITSWIDDFDNGFHGDDHATAVVAAAHGGFLVAGTSDTSAHAGMIWLRSYGATGTLRFAREIGRRDGVWLAATPDGGAVSFEFESDLVKHDGDGIERWRYPLPQPPGRVLVAMGVTSAPDGTVYAVLRDNANSTTPGPELLVTLDSGGHEQARRPLDMLPSECLLDAMAVDRAGGILIAGGCLLGNSYTKGALLRLAPPTAPIP